jgi:hypothetical protein
MPALPDLIPDGREYRVATRNRFYGKKSSLLLEKKFLARLDSAFKSVPIRNTQSGKHSHVETQNNRKQSFRGCFLLQARFPSSLSFFRQPLDAKNLNRCRRVQKQRPQYAQGTQFRKCPALAHRVLSTLQWKEVRNVADAAI